MHLALRNTTKQLLTFSVNMMPSTAFVSATPLVLGSRPRGHSTISRNAPVAVPRRSRHAVMMTDQPDAPEPEAIPEQEKPKEPYSGFYADMKRMGISEDEAYAQASKAQKQSNPTKSTRVGGKKSLLKPDGTPYAPWMVGIKTDYDPTVKKKRTDATGKLAADPQSGELSGMGIQWKMLGDELELSWGTASEEGNLGFVVYRRQGKSSEWTKLADYRDAPAELLSKGDEGGSYSFLVTDPQPGSWVYRVSDVDGNMNVADLAQVLVEVESAEDNKIQMIALAGLVGLLLLAVLAGISLDPLSSA